MGSFGFWDKLADLLVLGGLELIVSFQFSSHLLGRKGDSPVCFSP